MRHPLDNFIAGWLDENSEAFVFLADDEDPNADGMVEIRGEVNISALTRAILDKFAVVELPKSVDSHWANGMVREYYGEIEYHTPFGAIVLYTPAGAEQLAADLLAAARRGRAHDDADPEEEE